MSETQYRLFVIEDNEADIYLIRRALKGLSADPADGDSALAAPEKTNDRRPDAIFAAPGFTSWPMPGGVRHAPKPRDLKTFLHSVNGNVKGMLAGGRAQAAHQAT